MLVEVTAPRLGGAAGGKDKYGYIQIGIDGAQYKAHRLAWLYVYGEMPKHSIDHVNHDKVDNRRVNLRTVTQQENGKNKSMHSNNKSGYTGVRWYKPTSKWRACIVIDGKLKNLGLFTNKQDAIEARQAANIKYGFHENHGE